MNYYWWRDIYGHAGNVYAENKEKAKIIVEKAFGHKVDRVELLEENVKVNNFTHKPF